MTVTASPTRPAELAALVETLAGEPAAWLPKVQFASGERWWTRLSSDGITEVWLLTWDQQTATDLHDHGESAGAFTVLTGSLEELRVDLDTGDVITTRLERGAVRTVGRGVVHDVRNASPTPAISLHAYSPPLLEMTYYEQRRGAAPRPALTVAADPADQPA